MTVTVNDSAREKVADAWGQVADDGFQAMLADMEADAPRDTGAMTQTLEVTADDGLTAVARKIHAPQGYSSFQDKGTGVYIGEGRIYPRTAKVLRWVAKDGTVIYRRSVKGTPPTRWWSDKIAKLGDYLRAAMP